MNKVSQIGDQNIRHNPIRCDWNDEVFTITKTIGRETLRIALTPDEEEYLVEQLVIKRQPWPGVS